VHDDFVHRLPSKDDAGEVQKWVAHFQNADKIALYERDVAREAAGEAGTPREMLSPRELALYNRAKHLRTGLQISKFERQRHLEMLEKVDVKVHTWVRAPKAFDCRVGFVLAVTDLAVIQDGRCKVRKQSFPMSQRWFPRVDPTFADIALFVGSPLSGLEQHTLAKPSPALDAGDRVVVVTGESQGSVGTIERVRDIRIANERVSMARVITPDNKTIDVGLAQLKRHGLDLYYNFRIHDRVRVVSGGLYVGATGRVEQIDGCFLTIAVPNNSEVVGATLPSTMSNGNKIFIISIVHVTRQWAIGDSVRVTRGEHENRRGVIFHLHQDGFLQLYNVGFLGVLVAFPTDQCFFFLDKHNLL
jgi:ribosomal protein L24